MRCKLSSILISALAGVVMGGLLATSVRAETVAVRTGEHETFTRIVIDFRTRPAWSLGRNGARYELRLENPDIDFALSDAFRRIRRDRLADLKDLGKGVLSLELACNCHLGVEPLPNQGLLIDVRDGPAPEGNRWANSLDPTMPVQAEIKPPTLPVVLPDKPRAPQFGPLAGPADAIEIAQRAEKDLELRAGLLNQLARAASQGLVTVASPIDRTAEGGATRKVEDLPDPEPHVAAEPVVPAGHLSNIKIDTRIDLDMPGHNPSIGELSEPGCVNPATVDIATWFDSIDEANQLGEARLQLFDSLGRADPVAYHDLARRLIYLSFGAEARSLLGSGPENIKDRALLLEMSDVMEGETNIKNGVFESQLACGSPAALWAVLAVTDPQEIEGANLEAVTQTVSALPLHLRRHLGLRIAQRLVDLGEVDTAMALRNAVERGTANKSVSAIMLDAKIDDRSGHDGPAEEKFETVAKSNSELAAEALVLMMERRLEDQMPLEESLLSQALAMEFELNGQPPTQRLATAITRSMIQAERVSTALDRLEQLSRRGEISEQEFQSLRSLAIEKLAMAAGDEEFLSIALREVEAAPLEFPARGLVATRFAALGLAGPARKALGQITQIPSEAERLTLAEIAVLENKPDVAESYLAGLDGEVADALLARARAIRTRPKELTAEVAAPTDEPSVGSDPAAQEGVIAQNRALLTESRAIRDQLIAILRQGN